MKRSVPLVLILAAAALTNAGCGGARPAKNLTRAATQRIGRIAAITPGVHVFEAHLHDSLCGRDTMCGAGTLAGFGRVKTRETITLTGSPPAGGCIGGVGTRTLRLASSGKSTLRLAVRGVVCPSLQRGWGTFKVSSGRGAFAGATGSGVILDRLTAAGGSLHLSGVLTLAPR
jgi:hypothetical protein